MFEGAIFGSYALCVDRSGAREVIAQLPAGAFRLAAVVATTEIGAALARILDERVFDRRTLVQRCVPEARREGPPGWLAQPHGLVSIWLELRPRELERWSVVAALPGGGATEG